MALPSHLLTLATLRLLTLSPGSRFSHVRQVPLTVLSELTARYLELLAVTAKQYAEQAGRTQVNARDVVDAINQFGLELGEIWEWSDERRLGGEGVQMAVSGPVDPASLGELVKGMPNMAHVRLAGHCLSLPVFPGQAAQPEVTQVLHYAHYKPAQVTDPYIVDDSILPERDYIDPLAFLPPIPDLSVGLQEQTIVDDETGRTVKRARRAVESGKSSWQRAVPYESSQLVEYETRPLPNIDEIQLGGDDSGPSSLLYFLETFNHVSLDMAEGDPPLPLRQNKIRKRAAASIHSNILHPSDDSLSGAIPTPQPRHARKQAGWLPYPPLTERPDASEPSGKAVQAFPPLHPFSTALPTTITESVPTYVLPHITRTLVPTMHPRYPTAVYSIRTMFEQWRAPLFLRATRIGPPGPLTENGAAGHYEIELEKPNIPNWSGETAPRMVAYNYDWEIGSEVVDGLKDRQTPSTPSVGASSTYTGPAFPQMPARQPREARERRGPVIDQPLGELPMAALPPMPAMGELLPTLGQEEAFQMPVPAYEIPTETYGLPAAEAGPSTERNHFVMPEGITENFELPDMPFELPEAAPATGLATTIHLSQEPQPEPEPANTTEPAYLMEPSTSTEPANLMESASATERAGTTEPAIAMEPASTNGFHGNVEVETLDM